MKIELSHEIELSLLGTTYNITYRVLSDKEKRKLEKKYNDAVKLSEKVEKIAKKELFMLEKMEAYKELGDQKKVIATIEKLEKIAEKKEELEAEFEKMNGSEIIYSIKEEEFDLCVGGADKKALADAIKENSGFEFILNEIKKNITKQSGNQ